MPSYLLNLISLARGQHLLRPLVAVFHLTGRCNLNCAYCEDYGARRTDNTLAQLDPLSLLQAGRVLSILRQATPNLILTGGEPLLYPYIDDLVSSAKTEHRFNHLTLLTNGLMLSRHLDILPRLDRLVISLDSLHAERWGRVIGLDTPAAQSIIDTVADVARLQAETGVQLVVNCVITPETLFDAEAVLNFCLDRDIAFAFSPQSFNNWPRYELLVADGYRTLVEKIIEHKKQGRKILGSLRYLRLVRDFQPYRCYPTLVPRVLPNGDLIYPCRPIQRSDTPHGGLPCNLTDVPSWRAAIAEAEAQFGTPPISCASCFQQCYAEPSLMQSGPLALLTEQIRFGPSRRLKLHTFAPG